MTMLFNQFRWLHDNGILGINHRNTEFTLRYNSRRLYPLVDDKLRTKEIAQRHGLKVPELYAVVSETHQIRNIENILKNHKDFVIKPARGSGGNGICVIVASNGTLYRKAGGELLDAEALRFHFSNILSGMFSLGGQNDRAMIEYRVRFDPVFEHISYQGVPDIRIIVFNGIPVMAMVRLPTRDSGGRANLHQGAVGAGVDLATGRTLTAVMKNRLISIHPDTGSDISGIIIPYWDQLLRQAAAAKELTGLGYLGVDMVIDRNLGPLVLELNARPGLSIQIANQSGLLPRLKAIEKLETDEMTIESRVAFAKTHFPSSISRNGAN